MYTHIHLCKWNLSGWIDPDEIYRYLSSNPHVANYVRTLNIIMIPNRSYDEWYNQVTPILQMLTSSLERITLSSLVYIDATGSTSRLVRFEWLDFPATFRTVLLDCIWSPNIIEASMERIGGFPLSIFNTCTRLKKLSLLDCTPSTLDAQFPPQIDSLVLSQIVDLEIVSWATTRCDLRSLKFEWPNKTGRGEGSCRLTRLLDSYADNLVELELNFGPLSMFTFHARDLSLKHYIPIAPSNFKIREGRMEMDPPLTISHIQKLTQLTVSVYLDCKAFDSLLPGIINLVAASSPLKRLILRATIRPGTFHMAAVPNFFRPLVSLADHPSLEHIEIRIVIVMGRGENWTKPFGDIVYLLKNMPALKILWNKGCLSVRGPEFD
jgi:hypothetical protein